MPINDVTSTGTTTPDATTKPTPKSNMDKDAFLKLLVAQISHQDPLKPMDGTEFVSQLSQFSVVEQAMAQSQKLDMLSTQLTGLANNNATSLVGKSVTIRGSGLTFDGVTATSASVNLDGPSQKTTVTIRDADGNAVRTMELGPRGAGALPITWDGRDGNGQQVAKGTYTLDVKAVDGKGNAVNVTKDVSGVVNSVSFDKGYPELHLDGGISCPISDLVSVTEKKGP
jgi:flagellar basal-body rod modification protein FlgD